MIVSMRFQKGRFALRALFDGIAGADDGNYTLRRVAVGASVGWRAVASDPETARARRQDETP